MRRVSSTAAETYHLAPHGSFLVRVARKRKRRLEEKQYEDCFVKIYATERIARWLLRRQFQRLYLQAVNQRYPVADTETICIVIED